MIEQNAQQISRQEPLPPAKKVKPLLAYTIIVGYAAVLFIIGVMIGKMYFWNTYSTTSFADKQISVMQEKVKANPKNPEALTNLGYGYFQKGDYNQALSYYKQALDQDKNYFPAELNLGLAYIEGKKYDLAVETLKTAVALDPKSPIAHLNLGVAYNNVQKYQDAIKELELADQNSPGNVDTMYQLGLAYEKLGKFSDAAGQYQSALSFDPKYKLAQQALDRVKDKVNK